MVGVIRMRGAPVALPTFATAKFGRFFDCGRAIRCLLPVGSGRFKHLVGLYGYQGAESDAEQLALTEQLFRAALGVIPGRQPSFIVEDFTVEPTNIPCLAKGISAGLWVDLEGESQPAVTCKCTCDSGGGIGEILWSVVPLLLLRA